jgi:hypothetical protein
LEGSQILPSLDLFRPTDLAFAGSVSPYRSGISSGPGQDKAPHCQIFEISAGYTTSWASLRGFSGNYRNFHVYSKSPLKATDKEDMPRSLSRNRSQPRRIGERALEYAG